MLIGTPSSFAIESGITVSFERVSFMALGFFNIHIGGHRYGVHAPDATMLACSYGEVERRIVERGLHTAPFAAEPEAGKIADAYRDATYAPDKEDEGYFGMPCREFRNLFCSKHLIWAPDGDVAFDDRSYVVQFDQGDRIRLIGFKSAEQGYHHALFSLADIWLDAEEFYRILEDWRNAFLTEWRLAPKIKESEDGA